MSIFGFYFVTTLLKQAGWPKRRSIFNSEAIVSTLIADVMINQMIDWSAALGACRPKRALQMIAYMHKDKDWEVENAPRILDAINKAKNVWDARDKTAPHDIIEPLINLSKHFGKIMRAKDLKDKRILIALENTCQAGLLWGLANPDRFKSWYEFDYKKHKENLPIMQKSGMKIDFIPTLAEFLKESEGMLNGYEREISPLPGIPSKLLADARALGREITD